MATDYIANQSKEWTKDIKKKASSVGRKKWTKKMKFLKRFESHEEGMSREAMCDMLCKCQNDNTIGRFINSQITYIEINII
jgi:hypothetical protein